MPSSSSKHSAEGRVALQKLVLPAHRQRGLVDDWAQREAGGDLGDAFHLGEFVPEELLERAERTHKDAQLVIRLAGHQIAFHDFGKFRSEEHTSELQSLMRTSYAVFCLKKKKNTYHKSNEP